MKINVYNANRQFIKTIDNVKDMQFCSDSRTLVKAIETCPYCGSTQLMTTQVPAGYFIQNVTNNEVKGDK